MITSGLFAQALYQGTWLPCTVLEEDRDAGQVFVRVSDRTGVHEVWLDGAKVRRP